MTAPTPPTEEPYSPTYGELLADHARLLDQQGEWRAEIRDLRAAYERVVAERDRARRCLREHADCDEPECQVEIEAALGLGDDPMEIRANMAETELSRLRSDLNQATAVVEAAEAYIDHYPELIAVLRGLSAEDRRAGDGNEVRIALADAVDAYRTGETE